MPRVYLTEQDRSSAQLSKWVYGEMKAQRITQTNLAKLMNISQQSLSRKLRENSFDYSDFLFFVQKFQPDMETLRHIVGL